MSPKQYSSRLAAAALAVAGAVAPAGGGQCPPGVREAAAAVAALHGEASLEVQCETVPAAELAGRLRRQLEASLAVPLETELEIAWRLGLTGGKRPGEIEGPLFELLSSQVLGFYDPVRDTVVLVAGQTEAAGLPGMDALVWSHEVEHAYQEHRYGLGSRMLALRGDTDAQLAASAVAEGDAVLVMAAIAVASENPTPAELADAAGTILDALGALTGALPGTGVPAPFVEQLLFPYREGTRFVAAALREGGWRAVAAELADPPASTEQLLHPDRRRDRPTPLAAEDLPEAPGWQTVVTDVTGEWGFAQWLGVALPAGRAQRAAAGWDGDLTRVSRRAGGVWRLDIVSVWDTAEDAAEAAAAFTDALPKLLVLGPGPPAVEVTRRGGRVTVTASGAGAPLPRHGGSAVPSSPGGAEPAPPAGR